MLSKYQKEFKSLNRRKNDEVGYRKTYNDFLEILAYVSLKRGDWKQAEEILLKGMQSTSILPAQKKRYFKLLESAVSEHDAVKAESYANGYTEFIKTSILDEMFLSSEKYRHRWEDVGWVL